MTDWAFIVVPLLVLPIVLLFRFLGCGFEGVATGDLQRPRYRDYIMAEPNNADVIAYWRLVDAASALAAKDEKGFQNGEYKEGLGLPPEAPGSFGSGSAGSEGAPGGFVSGKPGLIISDPKAMGRFFNGGHVLVPYKPDLYTDEFTIEAWIEVGWRLNNPGYEHVLFSAGGHYMAPFENLESFHGFSVFADRAGRWQVLIIGDKLVLRSPPPPIVPQPGKTHVAVTVQNDGASTHRKSVLLYVDGKVGGAGTAEFYSRPDGAPLFIGIGGRTANPEHPEPRFPMLSLIQEVVLHKKALSQKEIENHVDINK